MSKTYLPYEPDQQLLLPAALQEWLPDDHLAYFISDVVDQLDMSEVTARYERERRGGPPYHPRMMVKVLLYGYCVGVASSRRIAQRLHEDIAFRVLAANNTPDFRTISDLRKDNLDALSGLFAKDPSAFQESPGATFVLAAQEAGGTIEDETEDIAFSINVVRSGITNQDLGSNAVTMTVSKSWYDQKVAEDKFIIITKIDDEGNVFTTSTTCAVSGDVVMCTADFTGSAGGFSIFTLVAIVPGPQATATPSPIPTPVLPITIPTTTPVTASPTATPTPTEGLPLLASTPTPVSPTPAPATVSPSPRPTPSSTAVLGPTPTIAAEGGSPIVPIVVVIMLLAFGAGGAYFLIVMRRKGRGNSASGPTQESDEENVPRPPPL